jgi:hypothetical protein
MMVGLKRISMAIGLLAAMTASARAQSVNQATAQAVADVLRSTPSLSGYRIEIEVRQGVVTLFGTIATPAQRAEAIARARQVGGVKVVNDQMSLAGQSGVSRTQYVPQVALGGHFRNHGYAGGGEVGNGYVGDSSSMMSQPGGVISQPGGANLSGPLPESAAGLAGGTQAAVPGYPNYAWPSYAPYPNFSAVGYPTVYPWQAWPNIGPPYPYPEVPLDWRAVSLRWDDGIWWLDFKKHYTRPFFTPYPFGIFAY